MLSDNGNGHDFRGFAPNQRGSTTEAGQFRLLSCAGARRNGSSLEIRIASRRCAGFCGVRLSVPCGCNGAVGCRSGDGSGHANSNDETDLEDAIRAHGMEMGIKRFRLEYRGHRAQAETVTNSDKAHPWWIKSHHEMKPATPETIWRGKLE